MGFENSIGKSSSNASDSSPATNSDQKAEPSSSTAWDHNDAKLDSDFGLSEKGKIGATIVDFSGLKSTPSDTSQPGESKASTTTESDQATPATPGSTVSDKGFQPIGAVASTLVTTSIAAT